MGIRCNLKRQKININRNQICIEDSIMNLCNLSLFLDEIRQALNSSIQWEITSAYRVQIHQKEMLKYTKYYMLRKALHFSFKFSRLYSTIGKWGKIIAKNEWNLFSKLNKFPRQELIYPGNKLTDLTNQWKWGEIAGDRKSKQRAHVWAETYLHKVSITTQIPKLDMQPPSTTTNQFNTF
jgi:hypothetical protein